MPTHVRSMRFIRHASLRGLRLITACTLLLAFLATALPAHAATTYTVDTPVDENDGSCSDGDCSLRDAIALASNGNTIQFAQSMNGEGITLTLGQLTIDKDLTIENTNGVSITIDGVGS